MPSGSWKHSECGSTGAHTLLWQLTSSSRLTVRQQPGMHRMPWQQQQQHREQQQHQPHQRSTLSQTQGAACCTLILTASTRKLRR